MEGLLRNLKVYGGRENPFCINLKVQNPISPRHQLKVCSWWTGRVLAFYYDGHCRKITMSNVQKRLCIMKNVCCRLYILDSHSLRNKNIHKCSQKPHPKVQKCPPIYVLWLSQVTAPARRSHAAVTLPMLISATHYAKYMCFVCKPCCAVIGPIMYHVR